MSVLKAGLCACMTQHMVEVLSQNEITTAVDFISLDIEEICSKTALPYKDLLATRRVLLAQYSAFPINGCDLYEDTLSTAAVLSTGFPSLDQLLDGGVYTSEITEIVGGPGVGKTQICLRTSVSVAKLQGNAVFIDTNGSFSCEWLADFLEIQDLSPQDIKEICSRIHCVKVFDIFDMLSYLGDLRTKLNEQSETFYCGIKLVIVDSVAAIVSPILGGKQIDGHGLMMHLAQALKSLAVEHSIAVLTTNNTVMGDGGHTKAALGKSWCSVPNTRLALTSTFQLDHMTRDIERKCEITKSSRQPIGGTTVLSI
ncbi:DNA repair protein RAD51 homolog 4-like [Lineus longissimus]|uniref:DNA repair protein RAD51 homolog 4-like n=1 Tax=Lineus longissimus TaxID=88925 RepID=UPI00315D9E0B